MLAEAVVWNIGVQGCLQPLGALVVAGIVCPAVAVVILAGKYFFWLYYSVTGLSRTVTQALVFYSHR